jgi:PTS system ascorbate-specific IIB component
LGKVSGERRIMMRILAICGVGQGTSLILKMNIEEVVKDLGQEAKVDFMDVSSARGDKANIIVTNPQLAPQLEGHAAEVIVVRNYTDKEEIRDALGPVLERAS